MVKQILLTSSLLAAIQVMAMERVKEVSIEEDSLQIKEKVKIFLLGDEDNVTHEVVIPVRHAKLIGSLLPLLEGSAFDLKDGGLPLRFVGLDNWCLIEKQLERVYLIVHEIDNTRQLKREIAAEYSDLDSKTLMNLIKALDFVDMPILLEIAVESLLGRDLKNISYEDVSLLPGDLGNRFIVQNILRKIGALPAKERHAEAVSLLCLGLDGKHIVSGSSDNTLRIGTMQGLEVAVCRGHEESVKSVYLTPDGKHIVSGSTRENTVRVWDMQGHEVAVCKGPEGSVFFVCVTSDVKHIASGSASGAVRIWDKQGREVGVCMGHEAPVAAVCATPDNKYIVSASYDKTLRIWDLQGNEVAVCVGHEGAVMSVCVTPDGKHIVSGSVDKTIRVWDMQGHQVALCSGHEDRVVSVYVTRDGKHIVSGSWDNTVRMWDMVGNKVAVCGGHNELVYSVCVTPDGKHIVSGSTDKTVRLWDIGLLNRILRMGEDQAKALWDYLLKLPNERDHQKCWGEIESILEDASDSE